LADILARSKLGIAIAAITRMMAITMSNSINENPLFFRIDIGGALEVHTPHGQLPYVLANQGPIALHRTINRYARKPNEQNQFWHNVGCDERLVQRSGELTKRVSFMPPSVQTFRPQKKTGASD
jgi:hypothetical protein